MTKDVWLNANKETAGDLILTGYQGEFKDMPVYDDVMSLSVGIENNNQYVLDFGCGVGRNSVELSKSYNRVVAYDLPGMIALVPEENKLKNIYYDSNWENVKTFKYDLTLASLVFQHIEDSELDSYLQDIVNMSNKLVLHSRTWIDHSNTDVLSIVEKYFIIDNVEYTKDPNNPIDDHFIATLRPRR